MMVTTLNKKSRGFTLVELITVIGLLAILAVLAVMSFQNINDNAQRAVITSDAGAVARALNSWNSVAHTGHRITGIAGIPVAGDAVNLVMAAPTQGPFPMDFSVHLATGRWAQISAPGDLFTTAPLTYNTTTALWEVYRP